MDQEGNNFMDGGIGNDNMEGGCDNDLMHGGADNDRMWGDNWSFNGGGKEGDDIL